MSPVLGQGVYRLSEVIRYTGLPPTTVRAWFRRRPGRVGNGPLFVSDYDEIDGDFAVSFLNLVDAYVAGILREHDVSPALIRQAFAILHVEMGTPHPFAHADLRTDGARIIQRNFCQKGDIPLVDVFSKPLLLSELKNRLSKIVYADDSRLAEAWKIAKGITIRPGVSFGKPVVEGTGITTFVVANQYRANHSNVALVAGLFNIKPADVKNAVNFETKLKPRHVKLRPAA
jgi:uncharacterized protein (DUF433 family)